MIGKTDIKANPPIIAGFTDPTSFNAAYARAQNPKKRAILQDFESAKINAQQRSAQMQDLANAGYLVDPQIDAFVEEESTPWTITLTRLELGALTVQSLSGTGSLPVPPDLTPFPDPPVIVNEFAGDLVATRVQLLIAGVADPGGDVYKALPRGWQCAPGTQVKDSDGKVYKAIGQLRPGDDIVQMVRLDGVTEPVNIDRRTGGFGPIV